MLKNFKGLTGYTKEELEEIWKEAIFVVDTNILLNFYKYTFKDSTNNLMHILKFLKEENRLWIPHQVAIEYFFKYEEHMVIHKEGYASLKNEFKKIKNVAEKALKSNKSQYPYLNSQKFNFYIEKINELNEKAFSLIEDEITLSPNSEIIRDEIFNLLDGITGEPYSQDKIDNIEKEGKEKRYKYNIPPGFKDANDPKKQGFRCYGGIKYQLLYGDLIIWKQIIDKVIDSENPKPIIFITEEKKEDWWDIDEENKINRPHPQLVQEFINITSQNFYMYRTDNFVKHAQKYLDPNIITNQQLQTFIDDVEHLRDLENEKEEIDETFQIMKINENHMDDISTFRRLWELLPRTKRSIFEEKFVNAFDKTDIIEAYDWGVRQARSEIVKKVYDLLIRLRKRDRFLSDSYFDSLSKHIAINKLDSTYELFRAIPVLERLIKTDE